MRFLKKGRYQAILTTLGKLIKPLHKKGDKNERGNYRGISLVSMENELLRIVILFSLKDDVDKVLNEEQCGFMTGSGCLYQIFMFRLIIEKCLSHQMPLVPRLVDHE